MSRAARSSAYACRSRFGRRWGTTTTMVSPSQWAATVLRRRVDVRMTTAGGASSLTAGANSSACAGPACTGWKVDRSGVEVGDGAAGRGVRVAAGLDGVAGDLEPGEPIVLDGHHHVPGPHLGVGEHGGDVVDRPARDVGLVEAGQPSIDGAGAQRGLDHDLQLGVVLGAQSVGG